MWRSRHTLSPSITLSPDWTSRENVFWDQHNWRYFFIGNTVIMCFTSHWQIILSLGALANFDTENIPQYDQKWNFFLDIINKYFYILFLILYLYTILYIYIYIRLKITSSALDHSTTSTPIIYIYIRLKIKPNSVRIRSLSWQIFVLPSTGFELTPLIHCSTNHLALCLAP